MRRKHEEKQMKSWVRQIHEAELEAYSDADLSDIRLSDQFYERMERLVGRQRRRELRRRIAYGTAAAAAVALVFWLGIHPETAAQALDMVIQWGEEMAFFTSPDAEGKTSIPEYTLTYVPDGFILYERYYEGPDYGGGEIYFDDSGTLFFDFNYTPAGSSVGLNDEYVTYHHVKLPDGLDAHYLESENPDYLSSLVWESEDGTILFSMTGDLDYEEFLRIYEGIMLVE